MATRNILSTHYATRSRSLDYTALGMLLPNPDPILKRQGKDISVYRDMCADALIGSCISRRKASVQALEYGLDRGQSSSRAAKVVQTMLDDLPMSTIIEQMQDAVFFGYQPMEVIWQPKQGLWIPDDIVAKPPEWFHFDAENKVRFKTREHPLFGEEDPGNKYLLARQSPTYQNPYGLASLSMCYWPLLFKKGGVKFWLAFTEKFGSAFSVGKLPRNATTTERGELLDSLEALIANGVAVIPDDGSIELVEAAGKSASADLYEKLVQHCSGEIAIALLGQNQTTQASTNKASATAGLEVTKDLRDADARMIAAAINQLIKWVCEKNFGEAAVPVFSFWDQKEQDELQAKRDKSNYESGARFTNAYWIRGYGYQEGDLASGPAAPVAPVAAANAAAAPAFAEASAVDPLQSEVDALIRDSAPVWDDLVKQLQTLVDGASSLAELQKTLVEAFGSLDNTELVKLMSAGMALAELKGIDSVRNELPIAAFSEPTAIPDPRIDQLISDQAATRDEIRALAERSPIINNYVSANPTPVAVTNTVNVPEQAAPHHQHGSAQHFGATGASDHQ